MLRAIRENFKFLTVETENQMRLTRQILSGYDESLIGRIADKDDYIDNLKTTVENSCFSRIHQSERLDERDVNALRCIHIIAVNLERICDYCVSIARQTDYLSDKSVVQSWDFDKLFETIFFGLSKIVTSFENRDLYGALDICRTEFNIDRIYKIHLDRILSEMNQQTDVGDLITELFVYRYLERVGDSLLNIGEAIIFAVIGDRIKIRHFEALQRTLSESGFEGALTDIEFNSIWGSRSGCRISRLSHSASSSNKIQAIFKEGVIKKIKQEEENIKKWNQIYPGLVPRVFGYYEKLDKASLLVEFLPGCTLEEVVLTADGEVVKNALFVFEKVLLELWDATFGPPPPSAGYMAQLKERRPSVLQVHPHLARPQYAVGDARAFSTEKLMETCADIEAAHPAPFSIYIHGDFNTNNILYNHGSQRVHYVDLYRSKNGDWVQDASVFLVSNFRLRGLNRRQARRLNGVIRHFYGVFLRFAREKGDPDCFVRLALALARSFFTSCRFELNKAFARDMVMRSHYLMKQVAQGRIGGELRFPEQILYI